MDVIVTKRGATRPGAGYVVEVAIGHRTRVIAGEVIPRTRGEADAWDALATAQEGRTPVGP